MTVVGEGSPVLDLRGVDMSFRDQAGTRTVLSGVDLAVAAGEIVVVAGRSGSGKTTLLTLVAGWEAPDAGSITVLGTEASRHHAWADVAILPQSLGLLDELTVMENVTLPLRLDAVRDAADPGELMTRLGIEPLANRYPSEISLGEQQRTALARAAMVRPRVLIADEPISHQNHAWSEGMMTLVAELASGGTTCLLATHNDVAFDVADRVLELHAGQLHPVERNVFGA